MEDIESLDSYSPRHFTFSNDKNDECSDIENLLTSDTIEREDTTIYGHKHDKKSSKKHASFSSILPNVNSQNSESEKNISEHHSCKKKKKKHCDISTVNNPFMSARQFSLQPLTVDQSEKTDEYDMASDSEDECRNEYETQEENVPYKSKSKLPADNVDHHQEICDKDLSHKDNETKTTKIKPVFGRPHKKSHHNSKKSKPTKVNISDTKSHTKKKIKIDSLASEIDLDDPKSLSDPSQSIITDEDEDSFCLSAKICSQSSSERKNKEGEQIVPSFSWKKSKSKHLEKSPLMKMNTSDSFEVVKNSGTEKHKKKRSLIEISSAVLNSEHHHKKGSNKNSTSSEKETKEKKNKLKNSTEKSDNCPMIKEDNLSLESTEETCNIPKKKHKKSIDNTLLDNQHEVENNGPVITDIQSLADNFNQNLDNDEGLCSHHNDTQLTPESPTSPDKVVDQHEHKKKKKKKKKSKDESPKEESELYEKLVKKHKKKKKENPDRNENVKVEKMPMEMVPTFPEYEDEKMVNISGEMNVLKTRDSDSDKEESQVVSSEEKVKCKSLEKSEEQSTIKRKDDKSKKKDLKKQQKCSKEKSKKKCSSSDQKKVHCRRHYMQDREIFDTGTWVQCTNSECLKWRFLHDVQDPITVPMLWTCDMNSDTNQNDCSYPEALPSNKDNEEFIYTKYTEGTVVWARVDGYPWWPAMVEMDPDSLSYFDIETENSMYPKFYHVVFFGKKVSRAWVTVSNVAPFTESKPPPMGKGMLRMRTQELNAAEKLAVKALELPIKTRLKMFSFSSRYKGSWGDCSCHACLQAVSTADQDSEEGV